LGDPEVHSKGILDHYSDTYYHLRRGSNGMQGVNGLGTGWFGMNIGNGGMNLGHPHTLKKFGYRWDGVYCDGP
jgi:hypothetical protein